MKRGSCLAWLALFVVICLAPLLASLPIGRWWQLQRLGQVPESVSRSVRPGYGDWRVAEWTTWWGRPLDPVKFWQRRVIWEDESAKEAAQRFGRAYPPIPEHMTNLTSGFPLSSRSRAEIVPGPWSGGLDGGRVAPFHLTDAENAYWNWFWRTQPKPPATLERDQFGVANTILQMRQPLLVRGEDIHARIPARQRARSEDTQRKRAREIGVPPEALTEEALFWGYVTTWRREYAKAVAQPERWKFVGDPFLLVPLRGLVVDRKLITEPLTEDQLKAANAWKVAYLQRLRREKVDGSYINAYLKAWSLSPTEISPEDKHE
jgi:hypothetical protein